MRIGGSAGLAAELRSPKKNHTTSAPAPAALLLCWADQTDGFTFYLWMMDGVRPPLRQTQRSDPDVPGRTFKIKLNKKRDGGIPAAKWFLVPDSQIVTLCVFT